MRKKILITGGAGFSGSNFARFASKEWEYDITILDALTYAGKQENLEGVPHTFIKKDIRDITSLDGFNIIVHFAAETHVDNSITTSKPFLTTNVEGTWHLLELLKHAKTVEQFIHISTDEVYGDIPQGKKSKETDQFNPSSPYAASKASAECFIRAYHRTYHLPIKVLRPSNYFGPRQHPEKLIPLFVKNALQGKKLPVYGDGKQRRCWLYLEDLNAAIQTILEKGRFGEAYNVGGEEKENLEVIKIIQEETNGEIEFVKDRLGHDRRYCVDDTKLRYLGWKPSSESFEQKLRRTIQWYKEQSGKSQV